MDGQPTLEMRERPHLNVLYQVGSKRAVSVSSVWRSHLADLSGGSRIENRNRGEPRDHLRDQINMNTIETQVNGTAEHEQPKSRRGAWSRWMRRFVLTILSITFWCVGCAINEHLLEIEHMAYHMAWGFTWGTLACMPIASRIFR